MNIIIRAKIDVNKYGPLGKPRAHDVGIDQLKSIDVAGESKPLS